MVLSFWHLLLCTFVRHLWRLGCCSFCLSSASRLLSPYRVLFVGITVHGLVKALADCTTRSSYAQDYLAVTAV